MSSTKISHELITECQRLIEEELKYNEIGNDEHLQISSCKVAKGSKYRTVLGQTFTIAQITFMAYKKRKCKVDKELSHICGRDKCFIFKHIEEKLHPLNNKRKSCHGEIKDYFEMIYKNLPHSKKDKTPGPLFVKDIPEKVYSKLRPGPKTDKKYKKSSPQREKERLHRIRYRKQHGKNYIKPVSNRKPFTCRCRPICFMNFNKIIKQTRYNNRNRNN